MGQNSSTQKKKSIQKPNWRPEVLLTEVIETADYDPITIRKRKNSEGTHRQNGPNKKDVNKAIKFASEILPLYTHHDEAHISVGASPLITMDINTFSQDKALTDSKVQEQIKRVCSEGQKNSALAKELFNEQAGNMFKKFSFANQREELLQQQNKFFKVGSFGPAQSTPDISKYVEGGHEKNKDPLRNAPDALATDRDNSTPKIGGHDNEMAPECASFHSNNSPEKKFGAHFGGDHSDISAISAADLTKKQSISFRIESKDQSKASEEDMGFKSAIQARTPLAPIDEKVTSEVPDTSKPKPETYDNILIHNAYGDKPHTSNQVQNQSSLQPQVTKEEKTRHTKNVSQQSKKEFAKPQAPQGNSSKQWPSSSPKVDRKEKRSKENIQTDKYQLKKTTKVASDKPSLKSSVHYENLSTQKRTHGENYSSLSNMQRKRTEPLRQSNIIQDNSQGYKTNNVEKNPMAMQDMNQGLTSNRHRHERNNYQQAPSKKHLEATPGQQRTNKWLNEENRMSVQTSSPQFNTDVNPINVDLNLDELLRAADGAVSYGYPNTIQQQMPPMQSMQPMTMQPMQPIQPIQPMYVNYADMRFSPNYAMAIPFQMRFQEQQNPTGQYIGPKHLDETAYHEENSQFGGRNNNSMYHSRHDLSQDLSDYSIDAGRGNQLNNSYMRRNKPRNVPQLYILNQNRGGQPTEFH